MKEPLNGRYIPLFDEYDYLKGLDRARSSPKIKGIVERRNDLDPKIKIIHVKKVGKTLEWRLLWNSYVKHLISLMSTSPIIFTDKLSSCFFRIYELPKMIVKLQSKQV